MKLWFIQAGACDIDKGMVLTPNSGVGTRIQIPIVCFLIEADDGRRILVDTGMHRKHVADPDATFRGTEFANYLTPIMTERDDIVSKLGEIGLTPKDIDILVSTHFHFDHAGGHEDFGASRIVAQRVAYEWALANPSACPHDLWNLPSLRYELIDGDVEIVPGVTLLRTDGHVPGHMSVAVRLPKTGLVVIAIDAIYCEENLATDNWSGYGDPAAAHASAHRLAGLAAAEGGMLITGHDPAKWATLRHSPAFYE